AAGFASASPKAENRVCGLCERSARSRWPPAKRTWNLLDFFSCYFASHQSNGGPLPFSPDLWDLQIHFIAVTRAQWLCDLAGTREGGVAREGPPTVPAVELP